MTSLECVEVFTIKREPQDNYHEDQGNIFPVEGHSVICKVEKRVEDIKMESSAGCDKKHNEELSSNEIQAVESPNAVKTAVITRNLAARIVTIQDSTSVSGSPHVSHHNEFQQATTTIQQENEICGDSVIKSDDTGTKVLPNNLRCNICFVTYHTKKGYDNHLASAHKSRRNLCGYTKTRVIIAKESNSKSSVKPKNSSIANKTIAMSNICKPKVGNITVPNSKIPAEYKQCTKCSSRFFSESSLLNHSSKIHGVYSKIITKPTPHINIVPPSPDPSTHKYIQCTKCSSRFFNESSLNNHYSKTHGVVQ